MNAEQAERFRELLEEACDHFVEYDGGRIISDRFLDYVGGQCPLTCLFGRVDVKMMAKEINSMLDIESVTSQDTSSVQQRYHEPAYYNHLCPDSRGEPA